MRRRKKTCRVDLTQRALSDLAEIEQFSIKEWGRRTADKYLGEISAALDRIREDSQILRLEPDFASNLFFYRVKRHFLVCNCTDDVVIVVTVIHTSMDLPSRLAELEPRLVAESQMLQSKLHDSQNP